MAAGWDKQRFPLQQGESLACREPRRCGREAQCCAGGSKEGGHGDFENLLEFDTASDSNQVAASIQRQVEKKVKSAEDVKQAVDKYLKPLA